MTAPSADATVLALDLGGTQIRAAVVRADGSRIGRAASGTPVSRGPAAIIDACIGTLQQARDAARAEDAAAVARLVGIGISSPGPIDPWRGIAVEPPNLGSEFPGTDLAGPISTALNLPTLLEHDTKVAILGERAFGAGRGIDDLVYITISTGLGGAVISGGRLYTGPDDTGIELGHAPITLDGPRCACGGIGHLEAHASGVALARTGGEAAASGASPWLAAWLAAHPTQKISAKEVSEAAAAGDRVAQSLIDDALLAVGRAAAGWVNLFNPSRIIIGGSLAEAHWGALHSRIQGEIGDNSFKVPARRVSVHPAELGGDVSLAGCHPMVVGRIGNPEWERTVAVKSKGDAR